MKKIAAFTMAIAVLSLSVTAFADVAATDSGKEAAVTTVTGAEEYSVVLITDCKDKVVYANQADTSFDGSVDFLLKENPAYGKYTVQLGGENVDLAKTYFYVGVEPKQGDVTMKRFQNEETLDKGKTYRIGYCAEVDTEYAKEYNSLKVGIDGNAAYGGFKLEGTWKETHFEGGGDIYLIFQLNDVPSDWKDSVTVFLSNDQVSETYVKNNGQEEG